MMMNGDPSVIISERQMRLNGSSLFEIQAAGMRFLKPVKDCANPHIFNFSIEQNQIYFQQYLKIEKKKWKWQHNLEN